MKSGLRLFALFCLSLFLFTSCGPSLDVIGVWADRNKVGTKTYIKLFVFALSSDMTVRGTMEDEMAAAVKERGLTAVKSIDVLPGTFQSTGKISKEDLVRIITENGCDGMVTFVIKDVKEETRYVQGTTSYAPMGYGMYDPYYNYYNYYQPTVYSPGYYTTDKVYFLESNFYDVATQSLVWSVQSESINPTNVKNFSKQYVHTLLTNLRKHEIIK